MSNNLSSSNRILRLVEIFRETFDLETKTFNMNSDQEKEFNSLWESVVEELVWSPGTLIYISDKTERKAAQTIIHMIWETMESNEIFDEITSGGYSGLLVNIIGDYIDRAKMLRPTLISINPQNTEFSRYFEEAMKAWLYGLYSSSLILCCSIIEDILKTELSNITPNLALDFNRENQRLIGVKNKKLIILINSAYEHQIIDKTEKSIAHEIRILRNDAIHSLEKITEKQTFKAILDTKELVEKILIKSTLF